MIFHILMLYLFISILIWKFDNLDYMKNENLTKLKSAFLIQEAFSLLPQDKENPSIEKKILRIDQWNVADT